MNLTSYDKGLQEGELAGLRKGLLFAIRVKFGHVETSIARRIEALGSPDQIEHVQSVLMQSATVEDFLRTLESD